MAYCNRWLYQRRASSNKRAGAYSEHLHYQKKEFIMIRNSKSSSGQNALGCILALLAIAVIFIEVAFGGFVFQVVWNWYVARYLHTPTIPIVAAVGVSILIHMATFEAPPKEGDKTMSERLSDLWRALAWGFGGPALFLAMAMILHLFG
jgi:hypothetical protein